MPDKLVHIAVPGGPRRFFTYRISPDKLTRLRTGMRVKVPFGRRSRVGYFIAATDLKPDVPLKAVQSIIDRRPLFSDNLLRFLKWLSEYYFAGVADTFNMALPPELRKGNPSHYSLTEIPEKISFFNDLSQYTRSKLESTGFLIPREINHICKTYPEDYERLTAENLLVEQWTDPGKTPDAGTEIDNLFAYIKPRPEVQNLLANEEQRHVIDTVLAGDKSFRPYLLFGITGSGKTLVYCHIVREILNRGESVLVLVPEIALAGTILGYFRAFFGDQAVLMHSALRPKERLAIWQTIRSGRAKIVIGARTAIFSPMVNPGLIIVDEEHDESYKQDDPAPRFQARDAAVMRASIEKIPILLGSATPSLESFNNALEGRYQMLKLTARPEQAERPLIRMIDLREEPISHSSLFFTPILKSKIRETLARGNQAIVYYNRRGFSPRIKCPECGHTPECPHCGISFTYHKVGEKLMCHFCGHTETGYNECRNCGGKELLYIGAGTQKIEDKAGELFENAAIARFDSDNASGRDKAHRILADFADLKYNLMIGTQMVTKGIDFPKVSLVGVLMADQGLDVPDFRASEKLFAKLIQVSGRSGRGIIPGEVLIQTFRPNLDLLDDAARQDYETFFDREIKLRKELKYPPYSHLINIRFSGRKEIDLQEQAMNFRESLFRRLDKKSIAVNLLGPAPCPIYRLRGSYRRQLLVKTGQIKSLIKELSAWESAESNFSLPSRINIVVDIDPYDMM